MSIQLRNKNPLVCHFMVTRLEDWVCLQDKVFSFWLSHCYAYIWISCKLKQNGQTLIRRREVENKHEAIKGKTDTYWRLYGTIFVECEIWMIFMNWATDVAAEWDRIMRGRTKFHSKMMRCRPSSRRSTMIYLEESIAKAAGIITKERRIVDCVTDLTQRSSQ